ncbi:putative ATP-dependent RNA helicase ddx49 [Linnemannia elongata]|nr:putative ATP-dependent RNA helicase ddx49 [Linnemannia elongata]
MNLIHMLLKPKYAVIAAFFFFLYLIIHLININNTIKLSQGRCSPSEDNCFIYRPEVKLAFITSYFKPNTPARAAEIDICLASLMGNPLLDQIHVLVEAKDQPLPAFASIDPRTKEFVIAARPLMGDFIQYACDHLRDHRVIFANSDIFYDLSLEYFAKLSDSVFDSHFYAMSRWRLSTGGRSIEGFEDDLAKGITYEPYPVYGSYDTFAFAPRAICADKAKLKDLVENLNFTLGVLGSENRLLYEVRRLYPELQMENVCGQVKTFHIHKDPSRPLEWMNRANTDGRSYEI